MTDKWIAFEIPNDRLGRYAVLLDQGLPGAKSQICGAVRSKQNAELLASAPELFACVEQLQDCLVKCLTGGEVSAKYAGKTIENAATLLARIKAPE